MRTMFTIAAIAAALSLGGCEDKPHDHASHDHGAATKTAATPADSHAGHDHGAHDHGGEATFEAPTSLKDAVAKLDAAHAELTKVVGGGDLAKAHPVAERMSKLAAALPELATKGGLPPADVKEINLAAKEVQALFDPMDAAGDAGKRDEAKAVLAKYEAPLRTIKAKAGGGR